MSDRIVVVRPEPERVAVAAAGARGPAGAQGDVGPAGPQGPKGDPGEVTQAQLNAAVADKVAHDGTPAVGDLLRVTSVNPLVVGRTNDPAGGGGVAQTPVFVPATMVEAGQSGFSEIGVQSAYYFNSYRLSNSFVNAWVEFDVGLVAGTYTFDLWSYKNTDRGIYTVALDGTSIGTIDGYASPGTASRDSITGIVVAAAGVKRVRLTMATKNASSGGYYGAISALAFSKTA